MTWCTKGSGDDSVTYFHKESEENLWNVGMVCMNVGCSNVPPDMWILAAPVLFIQRLSAELGGHSPADVKQNLFYFRPAHTNGPDKCIAVCWLSWHPKHLILILLNVLHVYFLTFVDMYSNVRGSFSLLSHFSGLAYRSVDENGPGPVRWYFIAAGPLDHARTFWSGDVSAGPFSLT
jgi:hypothetical protein